MSNCYDPAGFPCRSGPCLPPATRPKTMLQIRTKQINKQVRMSSSQMLFRKKAMFSTKWLAQGEIETSGNVYNSLAARGPGDKIHSVQTSTRAGIRGNKARIERRGPVGVDKKHGSYARYLARRVGKVLRQETASNVVLRKAMVGQPGSNKANGKGRCCVARRQTSGTAIASTDCCKTAANINSKGRLPVA